MTPQYWKDVSRVLAECDAAFQIGERFLIIGNHLTDQRYTVTDMAEDAELPGDDILYEGDDWQVTLAQLSDPAAPPLLDHGGTREPAGWVDCDSDEYASAAFWRIDQRFLIINDPSLGLSRYHVTGTKNDGMPNDELLYEGDDWQAALAAVNDVADTRTEVWLAIKFAGLMREAIDPLALEDVIRDNRAEANPGVCHTHDHCDANMVMHEAFIAIVGRESDTTSTADASLWNRAWGIAKASDFQIRT